MSVPNSGSRLCRRSMDLASAPRPVLTGSSWATTRPRRTIVKCSPRCSTASRMSENFLAASVALTSGTRSDYQIELRTTTRTWIWTVAGRAIVIGIMRADDRLGQDAQVPTKPRSPSRCEAQSGHRLNFTDLRSRDTVVGVDTPVVWTSFPGRPNHAPRRHDTGRVAQRRACPRTGPLLPHRPARRRTIPSTAAGRHRRGPA